MIKYNIEYLNLENIANVIYNSIPKYQVQHIRLWLYGYVNQNLYNYVGYRESFKELTFDEQDIFKKQANFSLYIRDVIEPESLEVVPCEIIIKETENSKVYKAFLENIFFKNQAFLFRKEDGNYTKEKHEIYANSGFNRIPKSNKLNKKEIIIEVSRLSNEIINIDGLDEIFTLVHTGEIEKALGIVNLSAEANSVKNKSYVEDWKLRKSVIDFLNKNQYENFEPKSVYEPKNFYRRLDEYSGIDNYELTRLFSIETPDGFGIIWENIDLTEDRATYIFKSNKENHKIQLENIADAITSYAQFRSALSNTKESESLKIFKNSFGFITSIRKQRGKNIPFENWKAKLQIALKDSILETPSLSDLEKIKHWTPEISHNAKVSRIKKINEEEIFISNIDFGEDFPTTLNEKSLQSSRKYKTLTALKSFNSSFLQNLNSYE